MHEKTQTLNKALNGMVPKRILKEVFVGREILEMGLYGPVAYFNIGTFAVLKLINALGIDPQENLQKSDAGNRIRRLFTWHRGRAKRTEKREEKYSQLSPCGHLAITHIPIIRTPTKSPAKINFRRLTEIHSRDFGLSQLRTLTCDPESVRNKGR